MEDKNKKLHIVHILNTSSFSGAEHVAIDLINNLSDSFQFTYVSPSGAIADRLVEEKIQFYPIDGLQVTFSTMKKAVSDLKPDIIHTHDFRTSMIAAFCIGKRIPIICHLHNNSPWIKKISIKTISFAFSCLFYKKILLVSKSIENEFVFRKSLSKKSLVVGNPVELDKIKAKSLEQGIHKDSSDIIFLGRLSSPKNPLFFIDIVKELVQKKPDLKVAIVGNGELFSQVEQKVRDYNLTDNIKFYGFQKNPYGLLANSKVLCIPSLWEGYGLVAIEAMTLGKPVIASPVGGLVDIVDNSCGSLCDTANQFVEKTYELLLNNDIYQEKSDAALKRVSKIINNEDYYEKIEKAYLSQIGDN